MPKLTVNDDGMVRFEVHAKPRAKKSAIVSKAGGLREAGAANEGLLVRPHEDVGPLEVALAAPPADGAANEELVRFLAVALDVPKRAVTIVRGAASRTKLVAIEGLSEAEIRARLAALVGSS